MVQNLYIQMQGSLFEQFEVNAEFFLQAVGFLSSAKSISQ